MSKGEIEISIEPVTLVSQECIKIISEVRKNSRFLQSGVAAILGSSDTINLFNDEFINKSLNFSEGRSVVHEPRDSMESRNGAISDPILTGFLQLKSLLAEIADLSQIDSLTVLQPYFMLITSQTTSGLVTSITLSSLRKLLDYGILFKHTSAQDLAVNVNQMVSSLTHSQFESSDPGLDDSVLLKVLDLILMVMRHEEYLAVIKNEVLFEVVQINMSLACNKKRSEVLRRFAEHSLQSLTILVFNKLLLLEQPQPGIAINAKFYYQYLFNLVSIVSAENQYYHTESTKIFVLNLIATIVEIAGKDIPQFPRLLHLIQDKLFRNLLIIILKNDNLNLLQAALQCFISLDLILSSHLKLQLEFSYENIFKSILPPEEFNHLDESIDENSTVIEKEQPASAVPSRSATPANSPVNQRSALAKELIVESLSLLWCHSNDFLINLFMNYDCKFDRKNISLIFLKFLNKLSESNSASLTTNNVPPICLEGLIQFINGVNLRVKDLKKKNLEFNLGEFESNHALKTKAHKEEFLNILRVLNKQNLKAGIVTLKEKHFLESNLSQEEDDQQLGHFFYNKAGLLNKKDVGEFITKPKNINILLAFLSYFNFKGRRVDEGLRLLLQKFRLPGESQQISQIVENFAKKYVQDQDYLTAAEAGEAGEAAKVGEATEAIEKTENASEASAATENTEKAGEASAADEKTSEAGKTEKAGKAENSDTPESVTPDDDSVYVLSYAIIILNTDLHNLKVKNHMTFAEFKKNLKGVYNLGDFPEWYLKSIYNSIKTREIIIPEEHYGTDKWFAGSWDVLINGDYKDVFKFKFEKDHQQAADGRLVIESEQMHPLEVSQFDRVLFESLLPVLLKSFIHVFEETSDDNRVSQVISTIDKCANIAGYYKLDKVLDGILGQLAKQTTLTGEKPVVSVDEEFIRASIPTTQMKLLEHPEIDGLVNSSVYGHRKSERSGLEVITVSQVSANFGRDFKAQISFVALFNIVRKSSYGQIGKAWLKILVIVLRLFENVLVDGNFFPEFQQQCKLLRLPVVQPRYVIDKSEKPAADDGGIFSAFTSYLKMNSDEPPEPSNEEIEATLLTMNCIQQSRLELIFANLQHCDDASLKEVITCLFKLLPNFAKSSKRIYEPEVLFIIETAVSIVGYVARRPLANELCEKILVAINKLLVINEKNSRKLFKDALIVRLVVYQLSLYNRLDSDFHNWLEILANLVLLANVLGDDVVASYGEGLLEQLVGLLGRGSVHELLISNEEYWKLLRKISSLPSHGASALKFIRKLMADGQIGSGNFMFVVGLLDEISLLGAVGSGFEQAPEPSGENPHRALIALSVESIDVTCQLKDAVGGFSDQDKYWYAMLQALGHQTLNPCREIRQHALAVFSGQLLGWDRAQCPGVTARGIFELAVFPLINEILKDEVLYCDYYGLNKTKADMLGAITKIYLQYLSSGYIAKEAKYEAGSELSYVWLTLLDVFRDLIGDEAEQIAVQKGNPKKFERVSLAVIREESLELVKNSLLCMRNCGYVKIEEPGYLMDETWARLGSIFPELQQQLLEQVPEPDSAE